MKKFQNIITTGQLAEATGKSIRRIQQLVPELIKSGHATDLGRFTICHVSAIEFVNNLPDKRRGSKQKS